MGKWKMKKSDRDLIDYLTNVRYELEMMRVNLLRAREASAKGSDYQLDYNSHYESWAIHARNLYKFLNSDDDKRTNYHAQDYVVGFSPKKSSDTIRILQKLDPEIFHMGTRRPKTVNDQVNLADVNVFTEWVEDAFEDFLTQLASVYPNAWREPAIARNMPVTYKGFASATNNISTTSSAPQSLSFGVTYRPRGESSN
jgi:hypothetical protein